MSDATSGTHASDETLSTPESVDGRLVCLMRLVLSLSALVIIYVDPSEPDRLVVATYAALALYLLYSAALLLASLRGAPVWEVAAPWVDVAWYLVLISLSSGTGSVFFFFFFFAVLVASFRQGFRAGLSVTVVSAVSFTLVGFYTAPPEPHFEWNRFLLRPTYLFVLGYMMAYWGGREIRLKRELNLLREVSGLANPRFGLAHTLGSVMRRLRVFYEAENCLLVWSEPRESGRHYLLTSARGDNGRPAHVEQIPAGLAGLLRVLPEDVSAVYKGRRTARYYRRRLRRTIPFTSAPTRDAGWRAEVEALAGRLEAESFITVPAHFRNSIVGRLYLTGRRRTFSEQDVDFLEQLVMQVAPLLDNIRLLERLSSNAAEQERQRLARDIHDSVIQPYLGLQYRLAAIRNKVAAGASDVAEDLERLFESTVAVVTGLRGFVRGLKETDGHDDNLAAAVRRFAAQFGEDYGIDVRVECEGPLRVNARLASEVIRFVHEGLSNVRKHTGAARVTLGLGCDERACFIRIENDGASAGPDSAREFTPKSLTERARELGGRVRVEPAGEDGTAVTVEIPL